MDSNRLSFVGILGLGMAFVCAYLVFLGTYHAPLARADLNDISFHLLRASSPFCWVGGGCSFYPPLFHILLLVGTWLVGSVSLSYSLLAPLILFLFLPWAFLRLARFFWRDESTSLWCLFCFVFGSPALIVFLAAATIPQALAFVFLLLGLEAMMRDLRGWGKGVNYSVALWGLLTACTHAQAIYLYVFAVVVWLGLSPTRWRGWWIMLAGAGAIFLVFVHHGLKFYNPLALPLPRLLEVLFWASPLMLYLAGRRTERGMDTRLEAWLFELLVFACIGLSVVDYAFRPVLFASGLVALYAGVELRTDKSRFYYASFFVFSWLLYLLWCLYGIVTTL